MTNVGKISLNKRLVKIFGFKTNKSYLYHMKANQHRKSIQMLNLFAYESGGTINRLKAIKLSWLADRLHLRKYGRPISYDKYSALPHGLVASYTKDLVDNNTSWVAEDHLVYKQEYLTSDKNEN